MYVMVCMLCHSDWTSRKCLCRLHNEYFKGFWYFHLSHTYINVKYYRIYGYLVVLHVKSKLFWSFTRSQNLVYQLLLLYTCTELSIKPLPTVVSALNVILKCVTKQEIISTDCIAHCIVRFLCDVLLCQMSNCNLIQNVSLFLF